MHAYTDTQDFTDNLPLYCEALITIAHTTNGAIGAHNSLFRVTQYNWRQHQRHLSQFKAIAQSHVEQWGAWFFKRNAAGHMEEIFNTLPPLARQSCLRSLAQQGLISLELFLNWDLKQEEFYTPLQFIYAFIYNENFLTEQIAVDKTRFISFMETIRILDPITPAPTQAEIIKIRAMFQQHYVIEPKVATSFKHNFFAFAQLCKHLLHHIPEAHRTIFTQACKQLPEIANSDWQPPSRVLLQRFLPESDILRQQVEEYYDEVFLIDKLLERIQALSIAIQDVSNLIQSMGTVLALGYFLTEALSFLNIQCCNSFELLRTTLNSLNQKRAIPGTDVTIMHSLMALCTENTEIRREIKQKLQYFLEDPDLDVDISTQSIRTQFTNDVRTSGWRLRVYTATINHLLIQDWDGFSQIEQKLTELFTFMEQNLGWHPSTGYLNDLTVQLHTIRSIVTVWPQDSGIRSDLLTPPQLQMIKNIMTWLQAASLCPNRNSATPLLQEIRFALEQFKHDEQYSYTNGRLKIIRPDITFAAHTKQLLLQLNTM
jgi:hypothetical protein